MARTGHLRHSAPRNQRSSYRSRVSRVYVSSPQPIQPVTTHTTAIPDSEVTNNLIPATAWSDACMSCLCNLPHGWEKHNQAIAEDLEELREQDMQYDDR